MTKYKPSKYSIVLMFITLTLIAGRADAGSSGHERQRVPAYSDAINRDVHKHPFDFGVPGRISDATRTIRIIAADTHFSSKILDLKVGETVLFEIVNTGKLLHEFSIGTPLTHERHRARITMMRAFGLIKKDRINYDRVETGQAPADESNPHYDPTSAFIEPNDTQWVAWKFTDKMALEFACNIPGHYEAGMKGNIFVN